MSRKLLVLPLVAAMFLTASCAGTADSPGDSSSAQSPGENATTGEASSVIPRATGEPVTPPDGLPVVTLGADGAPSVTVPDGLAKPEELVVQTLIKGAGAEVGEGAAVRVQYAGWLWDGTEFDSSWSRGGEPLEATLTAGSLIDGWVQGLVGQTVGSQVMLIIPPALGYGDQDMGTIPPDSTLIFVVDLLSSEQAAEPTGEIPRAAGEPVAPPEGLPVVTLAEDGTPSIEIPEGLEPPAELVAQTLIEGAGAEVAEGAQIAAQYAGWLWDGSEFDSSWSRGGEPITATLASGQLIDGWVQGLTGQTVGSQVLLVIPPELGYGDQDNGTIPPNSTLVFVVDIIAAQ
jgi:peptidylprolyl isomerase